MLTQDEVIELASILLRLFLMLLSVGAAISTSDGSRQTAVFLKGDKI